MRRQRLKNSSIPPLARLEPWSTQSLSTVSKLSQVFGKCRYQKLVACQQHKNSCHSSPVSPLNLQPEIQARPSCPASLPFDLCDIQHPKHRVVQNTTSADLRNDAWKNFSYTRGELEPQLVEINSIRVFCQPDFRTRSTVFFQNV